jgi:hypothetical protein
MLRIKFADADRQRYGLPERVEYDITRPTLAEIRKLKAQVDWGWQALDEGVDSDDLDVKLASRAVLWWLAINRIIEVSWDDFDVDILGVELEEVDDPNPSAPTGASTS